MIDRLAAAAKAEFTKHWGTDTDPWPEVVRAVWEAMDIKVHAKFEVRQSNGRDIFVIIPELSCGEDD